MPHFSFLRFTPQRASSVGMARGRFGGPGESVMQLSVARIMNGWRGGDVVTENLETVHVVGRARDSVMGAGTTRSRPRLVLSGRIGLFTAKKRSARSVRGAAVLGVGLQWGQAGVWTESTPGASDRVVHRPDRAGLGGAADFRGLESGWSPTSGTCFP